MNCRFCNQVLTQTFVDLGMQPLANSYVDRARAEVMEPFYPLHARVCGACFLVQVPELASAESIFTDYAYLSSISATWVAHCAGAAEMLSSLLALSSADLVIEIASNDGCMLRCFKDRGIRVLGIEPARNVAEIARASGIDTLQRFFGSALARDLKQQGYSPKLMIGNNVLAHVPDINDFVAGMKILLAPDGVLSIEFPRLVRLIDANQFDTIYHEHFSYLSVMTVARIFEHHGLRIFDVLTLPTHGGSVRVLACHQDATRPATDRVGEEIDGERAFGLTDMATYRAFSARVHATKRKLLSFLIEVKEAGKRVVGYGAPAKGNTLLNYCGIGTDFVDFTVDRSELKQGKLLPGTRIPVFPPEAIRDTKPDYVLILPWNIEREIVDQLSFIREWGGRFVVPIPEVRVC